MIALRRTAWQFIAIMIVQGAVPVHAIADEDALALGQRYTTLLFDGRFRAVWQQMTPSMQQAIGGEGALGQFMHKVRSEAGLERRVIRESVQRQPGSRTYMRYSIFDKSPTPVVVSFSFTPDDRIAGFYVRPLQQAAPSPYLDYETRADLRLPFNGAWYVFWGGRSVAKNYHAATRDQRFAYDFVIMKDGETHRGEGTMNEDYYCWGNPILSPAAATVVSVVRLLPDNPPGMMDPGNPAGNYVILDLGNDEFALLAHMKANSISVEKGDDVETGQIIGQCGNSGNTSEPHLHFHLQDSADLGEGDGLPAYFNGYCANGNYVVRGEPVQGQTVSPAPPPGAKKATACGTATTNDGGTAING